MSKAKAVPDDLEQAIKNASQWDVSLAIIRAGHFTDYRYLVGCRDCDLSHPYKIRSRTVKRAEAGRVNCRECGHPLDVVEVGADR